MMVPNQDFGFSKLLHPVLVPEVSWNLTDRQNLSFSLRYAPLTEETFGMSFDGNREFAFRLGWSFALHDGNRFRVDLEITHLVMDLDPVYQVRRHTNGVSIGYEF